MTDISNLGGSGPDWQVTIWPHRSLTRRGQGVFLLILSGCFAFFALLSVYGSSIPVDAQLQLRVLAVVLGFMAVALLSVWWAFRRNEQDGAYRETLSIVQGKLHIEAFHPRRRLKRWEFPAYWTRVTTKTDRLVENQLILQNSQRAVAIGAFLTPEERLSLADEIKAALARFG